MQNEVPVSPPAADIAIEDVSINTFEALFQAMRSIYEETFKDYKTSYEKENYYLGLINQSKSLIDAQLSMAKSKPDIVDILTGLFNSHISSLIFYAEQLRGRWLSDYPLRALILKVIEQLNEFKQEFFTNYTAALKTSSAITHTSEVTAAAAAASPVPDITATLARLREAEERAQKLQAEAAEQSRQLQQERTERARLEKECERLTEEVTLLSRADPHPTRTSPYNNGTQSSTSLIGSLKKLIGEKRANLILLLLPLRSIKNLEQIIDDRVSWLLLNLHQSIANDFLNEIINVDLKQIGNNKKLVGDFLSKYENFLENSQERQQTVAKLLTEQESSIKASRASGVKVDPSVTSESNIYSCLASLARKNVLPPIKDLETKLKEAADRNKLLPAVTSVQRRP
jgi:hypothetical protein